MKFSNLFQANHVREPFKIAIVILLTAEATG